MSESSYPWNGTVTGDATLAPYDGPTTFAKYILEAAGHGALANLGGVLLSELNQLNPTLASPNVSIDSGRAFVYGDFYESTGAVSFNIPTPVSATRIDLIVLRKSWGAQTTRLTRVAGVEGGSAPALTQVIGTTWDIPIAQASITSGGVITLTDTRAFVAPKTYAELSTTIITASGTYTTPNAATAIRVRCVGAGGGSGGVANVSGVAQNECAGGGGGGAYAEKFITSPAASYSVTIGAAGVAGTNAPGNGGAGGDTIFGSNVVVAKGGSGGGAGANGAQGAGGAGGAAGSSVGDIVLGGQPGGAGIGSGTAGSGAGMLPGGSGNGGMGAGPYGGGGGVGVTSSGAPVTGNAGSTYGGGGSGSAVENNSGSSAGAAGAQGACIVIAYH